MPPSCRRRQQSRISLGAAIDEDRERRAATGIGERDRVEDLAVRHRLVDLGVDDPLVRDDLAVGAVERDLEALARDLT
jgi:hypothetical protein